MSVRLKDKPARPVAVPNRFISFRSKSCDEIDIGCTTHQTTKTPPATPKPTFQFGFSGIKEQSTNQKCHSAPSTPATIVKNPINNLKQPKSRGKVPKAPPPVKLDITRGSPGIKNPPPNRPPPRSPRIVVKPNETMSHSFKSACELQEEIAKRAQLCSQNKTVNIIEEPIEPYAVFRAGNSDDGDYVDMELYTDMSGVGPVGHGSRDSATLQQDDVYTQIPASTKPEHIYEAVQHDHHSNMLPMCPPTADVHVPTHYDLPHTNFNKPSSIYSSLSSHTTGIRSLINSIIIIILYYSIRPI